ncbi:class I SAM-dependent methyltransferase [Bradyrhizobium sp. vgs-9]|uniref:class I SAM-dependent methyltransferase n=1 Tax=Bradyrhizobium sp. vgs-9 TaxID=208389 RepID=UPI0035D506A4
MQHLIRSALNNLVPPDRRYRVRKALGLTETWSRVVMNQEVKKFIESLDCARLDVLEISGKREDDFNFHSYRVVEYPEYDICAGPLAAESFDLVIAEQVFEHIKHPDRAATHVFQMLRPGGTFVITTPFLVKIHPAPLDCFRWSQEGIQILLESAGFSVLTTGSWGNRQCLMTDLKPDMRWAYYIPAIHSLKNDPQLPISVWAFARKPSLA